MHKVVSTYGRMKYGETGHQVYVPLRNSSETSTATAEATYEQTLLLQTKADVVKTLFAVFPLINLSADDRLPLRMSGRPSSFTLCRTPFEVKVSMCLQVLQYRMS